MIVSNVPISQLAEINPRVPNEAKGNMALPVSFLPMSAISEKGYIENEEVRIIGDVFRGYTYFERGDVLVAKITPCLENGKAAIADKLSHKIGFGTTEFHILRPKKGTHPRYLFHQIWNPRFRFYATRAMKGAAGQKRVPVDFFDRYEVPFPKYDEQKRIAAILDKADGIRRKRQQAIQLADEFLRSVFLDMFGDPVTNPKGWEKVFLRDAILDIISGWSIKGESRKKRRGELGILKVSAVTSGYFKPQEHKTISEPPTGRNLIHPEKDDLLFSRANTRELVAATCIVNQNYPDLLLPDKLWKLIFNEDLIDPYFFHAALSNNRLRSELTKTATGTSGSMLNVSMEKLRNLLIPAPPITIQRKFREIYSRIESTKNQSNHSLSYAENLFNSLTQRAFKGEL